MINVRRILARGLVGMAALGGAVLITSLSFVDSRPYFHAPYYAETQARWRAHPDTNVADHGTLAAGFGRARLTPTLNATADEPLKGAFRALPLAGYGDRQGRPATGVHDDLYVKAVALRVGDVLGVFVGADALIVPPEVAEAVARRLHQEFGLEREQVYLSATHTHCSLGGWGEGLVAEAFAGRFQPGVREWFADCIVTAVRQAVTDLQPASFGQGHFAAPAFVRNRLVGALGQVDPEFVYAVFRQDGGSLAVLGSYAAHATVLSGKVMEFSGDYPGFWQQTVEEATGGTALFLAGGMGSHSPVPANNGFAGAEQMGKALANRLLEHLPKLRLTNSIAFGTVGLELTLPPPNVRISDALRLRPWLARKLLRSRDRTFLQVFRLDDSVWVSTPCDFSGELALRLKDFMRARGSDAVLTSFNGDYIGYVLPSRYYHLDGYEPRLMSFFGPTVPDYFDEMIRTLALSLIEP